MASITIPNSVTSISAYAFFNCSELKSVIIPNSVTSINFFAFYFCTKLTDIYCYAGNVPTTSSLVFSDIFEHATLHVPSASIDSYKAESPWNSFKKIVALTDDDPKPSAVMTYNADAEKEAEVYTLNGRRIAQHQKGLNIIRTNDGRTIKVVVK